MEQTFLRLSTYTWPKAYNFWYMRSSIYNNYLGMIEDSPIQEED